jgi:hypothetical protein
MKRIIQATFAVIAMSLLAMSAIGAASLSFSTVVDNLDLRKNTKLHVREYWKSIQDQQVSWSGEAYDVQGGFKSRVKLYIADKSRPLYKGYNIVVSTMDVEKAANIKKGQRVRFSGSLHEFSAKRSGAVIEITDAQLQ